MTMPFMICFVIGIFIDVVPIKRNKSRTYLIISSLLNIVCLPIMFLLIRTKILEGATYSQFPVKPILIAILGFMNNLGLVVSGLLIIPSMLV